MVFFSVNRWLHLRKYLLEFAAIACFKMTIYLVTTQKFKGGILLYQCYHCQIYR
jgi:hypothetical protein